MKNRLQNLLYGRKTLYLVLAMVIVSVFTLTIAYAALNAVLTISGNAQVSSADWDIHLANPKVTNGSVTTTVPTLATGKSLTFSTTLNMPGDFYEFTVDVVNSGSIDAMIEKVTKTPELTADQAKFLKYEVSYANGESIADKQAIAAGVTMPIKVRVEYRKDLSSADLPTGQVQLTLGLVLDYVQSDGSGSSIPNNGTEASLVRVVSGDGTQVGNEICIKEECFYVISSDDTSVTMLSKYNLHVGNKFDWDGVNQPVVTSLSSSTGKQDKTVIGNKFGTDGSWSDFPWIGVTTFSNGCYWSYTISSYPEYVYNSDSNLYNYVENYKTYLRTLDVTPAEVRLISYEELKGLGCSDGGSCSGAPSWVYTTSYWSGSAYDDTFMYVVYSNAYFGSSYDGFDNYAGVRPVITISRDYL